MHDQIRRDGPLQFSEFMAAALYHPEHGYYARQPRQIGRGGDFFTSVSVGPLFGGLLARRFLAEWKSLGAPCHWRIIECGAHDGTLAADVLETLSQLDPTAFSALEYAIPEPLPRLQAAQQETLKKFGKTIRFLDTAESLAADPLPGIAFGNELLDALPFHVVEWHHGRWHECRVALDQENFIWENSHAITDLALTAALVTLGSDFPDGYRTEIRTCFHDFLAPLTRCLTRGLLLWPDYGFARPEFYHPDRTRGTLRTFSNHRAAEDPLTRIGEIDITAHVDFTAVAEAAIALGAIPMSFKNQGSWLTAIARDWLLTQEGNPSPDLLRQFQTLTHPAHLGGSFQVLEISWNQPGITPEASTLHRLGLSS